MSPRLLRLDSKRDARRKGKEGLIMTLRDQLWRDLGLRQFEAVHCVVTAHRGRFGVEVSITSIEPASPAFIDFIMLADGDEHVTPSQFPPVGTCLDAITLDFMPNGELRLSARPSDQE